jgi:glucose-6-phosphate-specific signal transduction histidine kinase
MGLGGARHHGGGRQRGGIPAGRRVTMPTEILLFVLAQAFTAMGVYAAIRADMREYKIRLDMLERHNERHSYK